MQTQQKTAKTLGALTVEQIYGRTLELQPNGASYKGLCPFPSEKSASFVVYRDKHFHCYGCGAHGSAFDFVMMTKHLDFPAALAHLEGQVGNSFYWGNSSGSRTRNNGSDAAPITVEALAKDKELPAEFLRGLGLKEIPNGVKIPYYLHDGSLAPRQRIRAALTAGNGSYWDNNEGPIVPYGLQRLEEARGMGFLHLAEGESDAWTLWYHDIPCLGIPGATMTGCLEAEHLAGISRLYIIHEPDKAGAGFVEGIASRLTEIGWNGQALVVSLAPFKDPNELHKSSPQMFPQSFLARLGAAESLNLETVCVYGQLASEVIPRRVEWLWEGRIPLGKIAVLDGDPGLGKSAVTLDLAARVTTGSPMPDGSPGSNGGVLVLNAEDDEADTIVPRLAAMGREPNPGAHSKNHLRRGRRAATGNPRRSHRHREAAQIGTG